MPRQIQRGEHIEHGEDNEPQTSLPWALSPCSQAALQTVKELEEKVATLEEKVDALAKVAASSPRRKSRKSAASLRGNGGLSAPDTDGAKTKLAEMKKKYSNTTAYRRARKIERELEVIGKDAPPSLAVEKWFTSESNIDFSSDTPTLLVFWEIWCPHCRREVPELQKTWDTYKGKIQMVGLTKIAAAPKRR